MHIGEIKFLVVRLCPTARTCFNYKRKGSFPPEISIGSRLEDDVLVYKCIGTGSGPGQHPCKNPTRGGLLIRKSHCQSNIPSDIDEAAEPGVAGWYSGLKVIVIDSCV